MFRWDYLIRDVTEDLFIYSFFLLCSSLSTTMIIYFSLYQLAVQFQEYSPDLSAGFHISD